MNKIFGFLLIAICAIGILFGIYFMLPVAAQYISGQSSLPVMPTLAYQTTVPLPLVAQNATLAPTATQAEVLITATVFPAPTATNTHTPPTQTATLPGPAKTLAPNTGPDRATFILDVTVPDGTAFGPNTAFTKIWRIRNTGSSTWTTAYKLVFVSGNRMSGPAEQALTSTVPPNATVDIPINLTSPAANGTYRGYWQLKNATGQLFGIGSTANKPFWVDILVTGSSVAATPIPTLVPAQPVAEPCNNILYPVKTGQQWLYQVSAQGRTLQANMVVAEVSGQQAKVDVTNLATGGFSRANVACDNGRILSFPSMVGGILFNQAVIGGIDVQYVGGLLAPNRADFESYNWGVRWAGEYLLSGSARIPFQGNNFDLVMDNSPLHFDCRTTNVGDAAFESITVAAGTFPRALKVICTADSQVTGTVNGQTVSGTVVGRTTQWFALNIGLLKMQVDSATFNFLGLSIPFNVDGRVELIRFQPAP